MSTRALTQTMTLEACSNIVDEILAFDENHLLTIATQLDARGRQAEAITIAQFLLETAPSNRDALLFLIRTWSASGELEKALEKLTWARANGHAGDERVADEGWALVAKAAELFEQCLASGPLDRAERLCQSLLALYPNHILFHMAQYRTQVQRAADYDQQVYNSLQALASTYENQRDTANELNFRLKIFEHKLDLVAHPAVRLNNIQLALSRILSPAIEVFDPERIDLAKKLITAATTLPEPAVTMEATPQNELASFARFYRSLIGSIDLDIVFGPAVEPQPPLPITYASATGVRMSRSEIIERSRALGACVAFTTAASPEYFQRFGAGYITSILNTCDCPCLIFVCLCVPDDQLDELSASLAIDDPRIIYCSDHFDVNAREFKMLLPGQPAASPIPIYYAVAALLRIDHILITLEIPVFSTGIDTILQRPVRDLLEDTTNADLVLNQHQQQTSLGSQIVNNLTLIRPTANGRLFIEFLKKYTGERLSRDVQPGFLDQLDMTLANHHVKNRGKTAVIQYFGDYDINNLMFNKSTMNEYREYRKQFRFLNIFANGSGDDALTVAEVNG